MLSTSLMLLICSVITKCKSTKFCCSCLKCMTSLQVFLTVYMCYISVIAAPNVTTMRGMFS